MMMPCSAPSVLNATPHFKRKRNTNNHGKQRLDRTWCGGFARPRWVLPLLVCDTGEGAVLSAEPKAMHGQTAAGSNGEVPRNLIHIPGLCEVFATGYSGSRVLFHKMQCVRCRTPARQACARCDAFYCGPVCQNIDFAAHRLVCPVKTKPHQSRTAVVLWSTRHACDTVAAVVGPLSWMSILRFRDGTAVIINTADWYLVSDRVSASNMLAVAVSRRNNLPFHPVRGQCFVLL